MPPGSTDLLASRDMSALAVGECRYGFICDQTGTALCDPVMLLPFEDTFWLSHGNIDLLLWAKGVARRRRNERPRCRSRTSRRCRCRARVERRDGGR